MAGKEEALCEREMSPMFFVRCAGLLEVCESVSKNSESCDWKVYASQGSAEFQDLRRRAYLVEFLHVEMSLSNHYKRTR